MSHQILPQENDFLIQFGEIVRNYPDRAAILTDGQETITYAQLAQNAGNIARHLRENGVGPEKIVALQLEKSSDYIAALLGTWMAGGAFIPLDPHLPEERRNFILEDSQPFLVLTAQRYAHLRVLSD